MKIYNKEINITNIFDKLYNIFIFISILMIIYYMIMNSYLFYQKFINENSRNYLGPKINNKEIILEDKAMFDNELDANGKDIIIILDSFNKKSEWHGNNVSDKLLIYFEKYLKKEIDIKIINLSFNEKNNNIENLELIEYKEKRGDRYQTISKESYSLETYIKRIRELNPNSKIILSESWATFFVNDTIVLLSKKYNYKIAQAYFNNYDYNDGVLFNLFYFYFLIDRTNTIFVSLNNLKPLWYMKNISIDDIKHHKYMDDKDLWSTSFLTPVLGYEYYLNKDSNIINPKLIEK